jgi:hypothetical protein
MIVKSRYTISARAMIPTRMLIIALGRGLDLLASPDENEHEREEGEGECDKKEVHHRPLFCR